MYSSRIARIECCHQALRASRPPSARERGCRMRWLVGTLLVWMLARTDIAMQAASDACRLFVTSVMPGLLPYMALSRLLLSRMGGRLPASAVLLLGWGGGSPTGAALLASAADCPKATARRIAVACATMSPMFLLGTLGAWLHSPRAALCVFLGVIGGGWAAGLLAGRSGRLTVTREPIPFSAAVEQTMRTMLLVCGTMAVLRMAAAMCGDVLHGQPELSLVLTTLLEVTTGTVQIAALPLPLAWRAALLAGATGFGGMSIILQNRALLPENVLSLPRQILWQALHAALSFLITLGLAQMITI